MPINLQGSGTIAEGWGAPPKLDAPNIAGVLGEILQQRRWQQAQTQKNIAETIKNVREERQAAQYLEQMKAAGLVPEGFDAGGAGGAELASTLAKQIEAKRIADARLGLIGAQTTHAQSLADAVKSRRTGGGGGGGGADVDTQVEAPEGYYGLHDTPGPSGPEIIERDGIKYEVNRTKAGIRYKRVPYQRPGQSGATGQPDIAKAVKEQLGLQEQFDVLEKRRKKQEGEDITALRPNVPFAQSDLYNTTRNRMEQLQKIPGMPSTAPANASPTPPPADTSEGHAQDYGAKAVYMKAPDGTVMPVDPNLVEHYKSKGAVIVPGP